MRYFKKILFKNSDDDCGVKQSGYKQDKNSVKDIARSILGVPQNTSLRDLKKAYINLIRECHPDKYQTANVYVRMEMEEKSKLVNWAYQELKEIV